MGGYAEGRIVMVGLNPQAPPQHAVYSAIQRAPWSVKRDLSDRLFEIFLDRIQPSAVDPSWTWTRQDHPGVRTSGWLSMVCTAFGIHGHELADHVLLVETIKHATADKGALNRLPQSNQIVTNCPTWAHEQLDRLKPRLVVLCGDDARVRVAPHFFDEATYVRDIGPTKITQLHGRTFVATRTGSPTCILFCIGISRSSQGWWANNAGTP
ncbi:MAG: uracil-DNA glycosylase family protein, partial [Polyangiaceae bacterium]